MVLIYCTMILISLNRGESYIEFAKWIKYKKSTINPKNNHYKCFQYAVTVALKLIKNLKEYLKSNLLLISTTGMTKIFHLQAKIRKNSN